MDPFSSSADLLRLSRLRLDQAIDNYLDSLYDTDIIHDEVGAAPDVDEWPFSKFRLEVWVYTPRGQNRRDNDRLAAAIAGLGPGLKGWHVRGVHPDRSAQLNNRGRFIPLQVDFHWRGSRSSFEPISDLREIFYCELSPIVTERLPEALDAPLQAFPMVLLPMGSGLSEGVKNCHTHIKIINPLQVRSGLSVKARKDYTMTDLFDLVMPVLHYATIGTSLATILSRDALAAWTNNQPLTETYDKASKLISSYRAHAAEKDESAEMATREGIAAEWQKMQCLLDGMSTVIRHVQDCIDKAARPGGLKDLNPQQLYETMMGVRNATLYWSAYKSRMAVVSNDVRDLKNRKSQWYKSSAGLGVVGFVLLLLFTPLEATQVAFSGAAAASVGAISTCCEEVSIRKHRKLADEFLSKLETFGEALRYANVTFTAAFTSEVLHLPLGSQQFTSTEQDNILRGLGVEVSLLNSGDTARALGDEATDKLERFCEVYREFESLRERVQKSAALVATRTIEEKDGQAP